MNIDSPSAGPSDQDLRVSRYDRVSSWLVAMNLLTGVLVMLMLLAWLTAAFVFDNQSVRVQLADSSGDPAPDSDDRLLEEPGGEEAEGLLAPQFETTMAAITQVVSHTAAAAFSPDGSEAKALGPGPDDVRRRGGPDPGPVDSEIPRWERWRIALSARGERAFAAQIDALGIHLALFGGGDPKVYYASDLSTEPKRYQRSGGRDEHRLYFAPSDSNARQFTISLLNKAGYATSGKLAVHFYPVAIENRLAEVETQHAAGRPLSTIRRTYFAVKHRQGNVQIVVTRQEYRGTVK